MLMVMYFQNLHEYYSWLPGASKDYTTIFLPVLFFFCIAFSSSMFLKILAFIFTHSILKKQTYS